jgi:hypothetical protein
MSKITMALLAFLAYKAFKGMNPQQPAQAGVPSPYPGGRGREPQGAETGGLMQQTGMERDELLATLSEHLPGVIDHLTPEGRLPTEQEASRLA